MVVYVNTHAILDARRARARATAAQGGDLEASQVRIPVSIYLVSHHRTIVGSIASLRICTRCRVLSYKKELVRKLASLQILLHFVGSVLWISRPWSVKVLET